MHDRKLFDLAHDLGASYGRLNTLSRVHGFFNKKLWLLKIEVLKRIKNISAVRKLIHHSYGTSSCSDEMIPKIYDVEYGGPNGPNYMYINSLLFKKDFETITGFTSKEVSRMKIIDVGAGSNELLRFLHTELHVQKENLFGSDVSSVSREIVLKDGFLGHIGRLEDIAFSKNSFDLVFLSYFIDYDTNQKKTFDESIKIVRPGGKIILEGKFPSSPFGLMDTDKNSLDFVTKGNDIIEDIDLVYQAFSQIGKLENKKILLERIVQSDRYVYSHYGLCKLPSYFLVFAAEK